MASIAERTGTASRRPSEFRESRSRAKHRKACSATGRGLCPLVFLACASPSDARIGVMLRRGGSSPPRRDRYEASSAMDAINARPKVRRS
jgi:hypothetical protein